MAAVLCFGKEVIDTTTEGKNLDYQARVYQNRASLVIFSRVHATLQSALSVGWLVGWSVGRSVGWLVGHTLLFFMILLL